MPTEGEKKEEFEREYTAYQPPLAVGPITWILDTIVLPVTEEEDAGSVP